MFECEEIRAGDWKTHRSVGMPESPGRVDRVADALLELLGLREAPLRFS
jgi:hypothetical protein